MKYTQLKSGGRQTFELHHPSADPLRRLRQMATFAAALQMKGVEYVHDLVYADKCGPQHNRAALEATVQQARRKKATAGGGGGGGGGRGGHRGGAEGGVKRLSHLNQLIISSYKDLCRQGKLPPLRIVLDPVQGFMVVRSAYLVYECRCDGHGLLLSSSSSSSSSIFPLFFFSCFLSEKPVVLTNTPTRFAFSLSFRPPPPPHR